MIRKKGSAKEAWLIEEFQRASVAPGDALFSRKFIERSPTGALRVWRENPPVPFSKLGPMDLLDSGELTKFFGCSVVTLYRWIRSKGLEPSGRIGRELFFRKADVESWVRKIGRPQPGRPKAKKK